MLAFEAGCVRRGSVVRGYARYGLGGRLVGLSSVDSVTPVSAHLDEAVLRRRILKMRRGEVCYLFPSPPELCPDSMWHGYVQRLVGGNRKRGFATQGHHAAGAAFSDRRYREVGLEAAVEFAVKLKPQAIIVA